MSEDSTPAATQSASTPSLNDSETPSRDERETGDIFTESPEKTEPLPVVVTERIRRISGPELGRRRGSTSSRRSFSRGALSVSELHLYQKAAEEEATSSLQRATETPFVISAEGTPVEFVPPQGGSIWKFSRKQWTILLLFSIADLLAGIVYSLQAPFYPEEAEKKGATATEYGFVFGAFELVMFLVSPIYGKYMSKLGAKNVFNACIFVTGTCCILFGLLDKIDDATTFITLSFVIRSLEAVGNAGFSTAAFTIIACEFPATVATTFASLETFFGVGLIVGPTMGGGLYQVGGFTFPFAVTGALLYATAILVALVMPRGASVSDSTDKNGNGFGVLTILKIPGVLIATFSIINAANSIGFLSSTLEPHIRQFGLSPVLTGVIFVINGGTYALTAPGWGALCDRIKEPFYVSLLGSTFIAFGFILIGPAPFLPFESTLWLTCVGLVIQGLGVGSSFVSGFTLALKHAVRSGLPDNVDTYSVVSGLWSSVLALGLFIGPSLAGILYDSVGFRIGSMFVFGGEVICMLLILSFLSYHKGDSTRPSSDSQNEETEPLLDSKSMNVGDNSESSTRHYGT